MGAPTGRSVYLGPRSQPEHIETSTQQTVERPSPEGPRLAFTKCTMRSSVQAPRWRRLGSWCIRCTVLIWHRRLGSGEVAARCPPLRGIPARILKAIPHLCLLKKELQRLVHMSRRAMLEGPVQRKESTASFHLLLTASTVLGLNPLSTFAYRKGFNNQMVAIFCR